MVQAVQTSAFTCRRARRFCACSSRATTPAATSTSPWCVVAVLPCFVDGTNEPFMVFVLRTRMLTCSPSSTASWKASTGSAYSRRLCAAVRLTRLCCLSSYALTLIRPCIKALAKSEHTNLRMNEDGRPQRSCAFELSFVVLSCRHAVDATRHPDC
jgi:hypothetical protein